MSTSLSDRDRAVLEFARLRWPRHLAGARDEAILRVFEMSVARYHQILTSLLGNPAAEEYDADLVARVRSILAAREANRGHARRKGF